MHSAVQALHRRLTRLELALQPGETVETLVVLDKVFGQLAQFEVTLRSNESEVARGRIVLSLP